MGMVVVMRTEIIEATNAITALLKLVIDSDKSTGSVSKGYQRAYYLQDKLLTQMHFCIKELAKLLPSEE
jgi:hypothetical protein